MDAKRLIEIIAGAGYLGYQCAHPGERASSFIGIIAEYPILEIISDLVRECNDTHEAADLIEFMRQSISKEKTVIYWPVACPEDHDA